MEFDYFSQEQSDIYSFYRVPKMLMADEVFGGLSAEAKLLYGLALDRVSLSRENGWVDENGHVYVYFTHESIKKALCCANTKASELLKELETFGLIERKRQGQGNPDIIYVKDFTHIRKAELKTSENQKSRVPEIGSLEFRKSESNNTKNNNTDINNTDPYPILSDKDEDGMDARDFYHSLFERHLEMDILRERYPYDKEMLDAILNLILDVICSKRKMIRIAGDDKPLKIVKVQFLKLNSSHIEYVMDCLKENKAKIRNIKQYMLATIYNATLTMQSYYQAWVNNDMAKANNSTDES